MKVAVITISDRCFSGEMEDKSGEFIKEKVKEKNWEIGSYKIVPDDEEKIIKTLIYFSEKKMDVILTTGGTGPGKRDITPEATEKVIEKKIPGINEIMRVETFKKSKFSVLSRGISGIRGETLIVNLPGSLKGVKECLDIIMDIIEHTVEVIKGKEKHGE